jgi:hypothetical protein
MVSWKFLEVVPLVLFFCIFTGISIFYWFLGYSTDLDYCLAVIGGLICIWTLLMAKYVSGVLTPWCFGSVWVLVRQITLTFISGCLYVFSQPEPNDHDITGYTTYYLIRTSLTKQAISQSCWVYQKAFPIGNTPWTAISKGRALTVSLPLSCWKVNTR